MIDRRKHWALAGALFLFELGCNPSSTLPGTALGTYSVTGTLGSNLCGSNLGAPSNWDFTVQLSQDGSTLYWEWSDGTQLSNTLTSSTTATLTSATTANVDGTEAGEGPCNLESTTSIELTLGAGSPPGSFSGSITYTFAAATGVSTTTDCTDQLSASGGTYDTLPCSATYALTATRQ
jgi:hypothetical protein